jgi:uncharacterized protein (TIGR00290 family)
MKKAVLHWSGGKDAALSLYKLNKETDIEVVCLVTTFSKPYNRVSMHGIREALIEQQAESIGLPLVKVWLPEFPSMETYEAELIKALSELKQKGIDYSIFGDIFLEDIKKYREKLLEQIGVKCLFPLWGLPTAELANEFFQKGFLANVVALSANKLPKEFIGNNFDNQFLENLPDDVDPCGENGEFHTFVFDGPSFSKPVYFNLGEIKLKDYSTGKNEMVDSKFWFIDLIP